MNSHNYYLIYDETTHHRTNLNGGKFDTELTLQVQEVRGIGNSDSYM